MSSFAGSRGRKRHKKEDAEFDITSFMNLMIVLVPVLLMMMVFSRITVVELNLPSLSNLPAGTDLEKEILEVEVNDKELTVYFPQGYLVASIPMIASEEASTSQESIEAVAPSNEVAQAGLEHDYQQLQKTLIAIKQTLLANDTEKKDIVLLLQENTDYQTVVRLIDKTRSYEDVLITSVVQAELFPEVSLSDAPKRQQVAQ